MKKKAFQQEVDRLWKLSKKDLEKIGKETSKLVKKGEVYIREISRKGERNLEVGLLKLQKERFCYELGKSLAGISKSKWADSKKADGFLAKIRDINRKIRRLNTSR